MPAVVELASKGEITLLSASSVSGGAAAIAGGRYFWAVYGTWDGATAQLQWSPNSGTTWVDLDGASVTANGGFTDIALAAGHVRVSISGAGGSTSLSSKLSGVT
jgi:hypothetical protein